MLAQPVLWRAPRTMSRKAGEDSWGVSGAQLVCVLCEGDVADSVHAVLDRPVPAGPFGQFAGGACSQARSVMA
jgi:hypothetical protein